MAFPATITSQKRGGVSDIVVKTTREVGKSKGLKSGKSDFKL
jgi:hypothetical protein